MLAKHAAAPLSTDRPIRRSRNQASPGPGFAAGPSRRRLNRERRTARQSAGEPKHRGLELSQLAGSAMRYTRPRSSLAEARVSPSFFFKVPEKTPRTV